MEVKTKFRICYAAIAVLAIVAVGLGYYAHDLKGKVDAVFHAKSAPAVTTAVVGSAQAYFVANPTQDVAVTGGVCVTTTTPTQYTCTLALKRPSTGAKGSVVYTVTYVNGKIMNLVKAA